MKFWAGYDAIVGFCIDWKKIRRKTWHSFIHLKKERQESNLLCSACAKENATRTHDESWGHMMSHEDPWGLCSNAMRHSKLKLTQLDSPQLHCKHVQRRFCEKRPWIVMMNRTVMNPPSHHIPPSFTAPVCSWAWGAVTIAAWEVLEEARWRPSGRHKCMQRYLGPIHPT